MGRFRCVAADLEDVHHQHDTQGNSHQARHVVVLPEWFAGSERRLRAPRGHRVVEHCNTVPFSGADGDVAFVCAVCPLDTVWRRVAQKELRAALPAPIAIEAPSGNFDAPETKGQPTPHLPDHGQQKQSCDAVVSNHVLHSQSSPSFAVALMSIQPAVGVLEKCVAGSRSPRMREAR